MPVNFNKSINTPTTKENTQQKVKTNDPTVTLFSPTPTRGQTYNAKAPQTMPAPTMTATSEPTNTNKADSHTNPQ